MSDVFISYSRRDGDFVRGLRDRLVEGGRDVWVDLENIPPTADWLAEIKRGIETAQTFVFVISPDAINSDVCQTEVAHAAGHNKRIVPLVRRDVDQRLVPEPLAQRNWIFFREHDDLDQGFGKLDQALDTEIEWLHTHNDLLGRALAWDRDGRRNSALLRGTELEQAEGWLGLQAGGGEEPTALHREFILASRRAAGRRQRLLLGTAVLALVITAGLAVWALTQRNEAIEQRKSSNSLRLAALADAQRSVDPERSVLLAMEALDEAETDAAAASLERALAASRVRGRFVDPEQAEIGNSANDAVFTPDGKAIATTHGGGTAFVWDLESGDELLSFESPPTSGPEGLDVGVRVAISPDGDLVAFSAGGHVRIVDARTEEPVATLEKNVGRTRLIAFSPDSERLATGSPNGAIDVWERRTGRITRPFPAPREELFWLEWSPDGTALASAYFDATARIDPIADGRGALLLRGHDGPVNQIQFSADGRLVSTAGEDGTARLWDARTGEPAAVLASGDEGFVNSAPFSPDGKLIVTTHESGRVKVWTPTGELVHMLKGHRGPVIDARFSPDGRLIATAGADDTARLWDPASGRQVAALKGHTADVQYVAFSLDGSLVVTASSDGTARTWAVDAEDEPIDLEASNADLTALALSPENVLATGDERGRLWVWDPRRGRLRAELEAGRRAIREIALSEDGTLLAAAGDASTARVFRLPQGRALGVLRGHSGPVQAISTAADGSVIATAGADGEARLWTPGGEPTEVLNADGTPLRSVAVSSRGDLVVAAGDGGIARVWKTSTGTPVHELEGHSGTINVVAFSEDGELIGTAGQDDKGRIWDAASGAQVAELTGHSGALSDIAFDSEGQVAVTTSDDGTARLWEVETGVELAILADHQKRVTSASFNAVGDAVVTGGLDGSARIWEVPSGDPVATLVGPGNFVSEAEFGGSDGVALAAEDDAAALFYPCGLCLPLDDLEALAERRITRALTLEERERFLEAEGT